MWGLNECKNEDEEELLITNSPLTRAFSQEIEGKNDCGQLRKFKAEISEGQDALRDDTKVCDIQGVAKLILRKIDTKL